LTFQTPIAEIPLDAVSASEARVYEQWRDGYQSNWRAYFDPIALRLTVEPGRRLAADVTVMPLIAGSTYAPLIQVAGHSAIAAGDGDPHPETLVHEVMALDTKAPLIQQGSNEVQRMLSIPTQVVLGWVGNSAAVYLDDDPFWAELARAGNPSDFLSRNVTRIPAALHVKATDGVRLAAFLGALRAYLEQSAPGLLKYESGTHAGQPYVRVVPQQQPQVAGAGAGLVVYYSARPDALVVTTSEAMMHRYLDRRTAAAKPATGSPWVGESLALNVSQGGLRLLAGVGRQTLRETMRQQSWSNLPILNEYHRLFPGRDPLDVHESVFGTRPACPGGGRYVWNERLGTMESTAFGSPLAPRPGPDELAPLGDVAGLRLGVSFEDQGLRARAETNLRVNP
jgi:hypothetical protein